MEHDRSATPEEIRRLNAAGFFSWGFNTWIHEADLSTLLTKAEALAKAGGSR